MNGLLNENFLYGFLLAKDREDQTEKLQIGLTAGQFPARNPLGLVLLKGQIDRLEETEQDLEQVKKERDALKDQVKQLSGDPPTGGPEGTVAGQDGGAAAGGAEATDRQALADLRGRIAYHRDRSEAADKALDACQEGLSAAQEALAAATARLEACNAAAADRVAAVKKIFAEYEAPEGCKEAVDEIQGLVLDAVTP